MDGFRSIYPARRGMGKRMMRSPNNCAPVHFDLLELSLIPLSDYLFISFYSLPTGKASTEDQLVPRLALLSRPDIASSPSSEGKIHPRQVDIDPEQSY
jgi:hypothetical protein